MAADTTILGGDVAVWYLDNNRTKMMSWAGAAGDTITMNELYSAMATLLDEPTTIENATAFNADTPVEYTTGKIDAGDNDPWYTTFDLMEHVTGGSLRTTGWTRVTTSNTGIIAVHVTTSNFDSTDIGEKLDHGTNNDSGTLLEIIPDGTDDWLIIRPDDDTAANDFNDTTGSIDSTTATAHTATQDAAAISGNMVWANIYSIGTIDPNVHLYVYRGPWNDETTPTQPADDQSAHVYSVNSTTADYWINGHIDICVPINDRTADTFPTIDDGYLRVFARKGGDLYASFEVANSTTSGGRNPVPMQTALDLNQGHGTKKISTGAWSGQFTDLEVISQASSLARGIIDLGNSTTDTEIVFWPIALAARGGVLEPFVTTQLITGATSTETATSSGAESADGPADATWFTNTTPDLELGSTNVLAAANLDIDNDGNDEDYAVLVNCNSNPLSEVYQWLKYICEQGQGDADMVEQAFSDDMGNGGQVDVWGEEYEGGMGYFVYTTEQGTNYEGDSVEVSGGGATGVIMYHDPAENIVFLRNIRGTFVASGNIDNDVTGGTNSFDGITEVGQFAIASASPFGTYAGGTFFGARGVLIDGYLPADENAFILTDVQGTTRERPTSITITVTNLWGNAITLADADLVGVYVLQGSGLDIDKDPTDAVYAMTCDGGEAIGDTTLAVDDIPVWAPSSGRVVLIDVTDQNKEYVIRYSSYDSATDTYTLANLDIAALTGGSTTTLTETGVFGSTKRGDLVYNHDLDEVSYVTKVDSANQVTIYPAFTVDPTGDHVELNCIPVVTTASDYAYNCIIHEYPLTSSQSASLIYPGSTLYFRVKVRNTREDDLINGPIKPYSSDGSTSGTNQSIPTVRTIDTVLN